MPNPLSRAYEIFCTGQRRTVNFLTGHLFRRLEGSLKGEAKAAREAAERAEEAVARMQATIDHMHDSQQKFMLSVYQSLGERDDGSE